MGVTFYVLEFFGGRREKHDDYAGTGSGGDSGGEGSAGKCFGGGDVGIVHQGDVGAKCGGTCCQVEETGIVEAREHLWRELTFVDALSWRSHFRFDAVIDTVPLY